MTYMQTIQIAIVIGAFSFTASCSAAPPLATGTGEHMKAIVYHEYGTAEVLKLEDVEKLLPNDNQVLIKVHAAAANPLDWHYMRGTPYVMRMETGFSKPGNPRMGVDVAGEVVSVGAKVTRFKPGDKVFGTGGGSFSEYVRASEKRLALIPAGISYEQAAAVPVAALTALQGLRDQGKIKAGQKVLINGASGGVGTFAVQLAKSFGAEVTGVCSTRNLELVRSLGADHVVDYTQDDFTRGDEHYDLILDAVGNRDLLDLRRALTPDGTAILVGGGGPDNGRWIGPMSAPIKALFLKPFISQRMHFFMADIRADDLATMASLMEAGKVRPVIDRRYALADTAAAIRYLEEGHARGKVIVTVAD